ncbi:hypothetical protein MAUB1S_09720 [Mycolicibacterium aubagnense]
MATRSTEEQGVSLRTDNIEGDRIVPATDWITWGVAAVGLFFGRTTDTAGIIWLVAGIGSLILALLFTFFFKKVQVLKHGKWETLKSLASPSQAAEIVSRLRTATPRD